MLESYERFLRQDADLYFYHVSTFLEKPVDMDNLEAQVQKLIG